MLDGAASTPQCIFSVVAEVWDGSTDTECEAIEVIESDNKDFALENTMTNLSWLNSNEARERMKHGPLMLGFESKKDANTAIAEGLIFKGNASDALIGGIEQQSVPGRPNVADVLGTMRNLNTAELMTTLVHQEQDALLTALNALIVGMSILAGFEAAQ
ncbi:hypothetical protein M422DRAFT_273202 [Sphaerobolus stellatus SS14]|uniref:Uncharacterized protein n=1 Tax=Sphaerobolus stellatus (strain SS14) TaxID=990650 RepID=A0A0C9T9Q7_SPHS4|nr:hypothetical protein M422DRAFT_273202 [Sphaerobolus stellatus SS14]